jgi:hypothetical protein
LNKTYINVVRRGECSKTWEQYRVVRHLSFVSKHLIDVKTINIYAQEMYEEISIQNAR